MMPAESAVGRSARCAPYPVRTSPRLGRRTSQLAGKLGEQLDARLGGLRRQQNSWPRHVDGHVTLLPVTSPTSATASYNYSLGIIAEKTGGSDWKMLVEISASEHEEIIEALKAIARLEPPFHAGLVERNYRDLEALCQFVTITLSLGREFASPDRNQLGDSLATSIVNWLTAMRLFLDHEATELRRRFGKDSPEVAAFTAATNKAFDADEPWLPFRVEVPELCAALWNPAVQP